MRIALVSTQRTSVPAVKYGSVELVVGLLAEELARRGHNVTVFGPRDSTVSTRVISLLPRGYHHDEGIWDWELAEFMQLGLAYEHASEFDVINSHVYCWALPFARLVETPTVQTFHVWPTPDFRRYCLEHPETANVLSSDFQRRFFQGVPIASVVYYGIDTASFPFNPEPGTYLAFLGDLRPDKRPLDAIRCARAAGVPLRIAGPETAYFHEALKGEIDGTDIEYVGELDHEGKAALLSGALGMVFFPAPGVESCPVVVLESLACGTPIVALDEGPVPNLVDDGVSGFYEGDLEGMIGRVPDLHRLDRKEIRRIAMERFDVSRMADDYLQVFERVTS